MKQRLLAIIVLLAMACASLPITLAGFSDTETSQDNSFDVGELDLKIATADNRWQDDDFRDDKPTGLGVMPALDIDDAILYQAYGANYLLWNAGSVDGIVYLNMTVVEETPRISDTSPMSIWYDANGNEVMDPEETITGTVDALSSSVTELGPLPACTIRRLRLGIEPVMAVEDASVEEADMIYQEFSLDFQTEFQLIQASFTGFVDTETSVQHIAGGGEPGGSTSFWCSADAVASYGKSTMIGWFAEIVTTSNWYPDVTITGDASLDYDTMLHILKRQSNMSGYVRSVNEFRRQYLATRLNTMTEPARLRLDMQHDLGKMAGTSTCFGFSSGTLAEMITSMENKGADGDIFQLPPGEWELDLMQGICQKLNKG